jgi:hypothetical protein
VKRIDLAGEVGASPSLNTNLAGVVNMVIISMSSYKKLPRTASFAAWA